MNPLKMLVDRIPAKQRKYVYAAFSVIALIVSAWQLYDGNWKSFIGALLATAVGSLATANTNVTLPSSGGDGEDEPGEDQGGW